MDNYRETEPGLLLSKATEKSPIRLDFFQLISDESSQEFFTKKILTNFPAPKEQKLFLWFEN